MGRTTFSKVAVSGVISAAILSRRERVVLQMARASSSSEAGVAVKLGGAWGGCRYCLGAMVLVLMPLKGGGEDEDGRELGRRWLRKEANRGPIRGEARMAVIPVNSSTAKRPRRRRDRARMLEDPRTGAESTPVCLWRDRTQGKLARRSRLDQWLEW